ncbi:unnamed protein product [Caenorhabditis brenneri]
MKQLLVFTAIVLATSSLPLVEDYYGPYWSENRFKGVLQEAFNSTGSIHHRFIRANADDLKAPLERLQRIARITNGIHILKELTAGKIPADELISELLFFGPVTLSEITKLDEKKIVTAIETLKNLPDNLEASTEASNLEATLDKFEELLNKIKGVGNLKEWNEGKQHLKDEIEKLAANGIKTKLVNQLGLSTPPWKTHHETIMTDAANADLSTFDNIKKALEDLKKTINSFDKPVPYWSFDKFSSFTEGLSPISKAAEGFNSFKQSNNILKITDKDRTAYSNFLDGTSTKIPSIIEVDPHLQVIRTLIESKETKSRQRALKHTHGLPRGVIDWKEVVFDVGDPWIRKIVTTDALKMAFRKLEELETLLSKSDNSLDLKKQGVTAMDGLLKHFASAGNIFTNIENVKSGIERISQCKRPTLQKVDSTKFDALKQKLTGIDEKLKNLEKETAKLFPHLKTEGLVEMCDAVIGICNEAQKAANIQDSVKNFQNYGKLGELNKVFKDLSKISTEINGILLEQVQTDAENVKANFDALDSYHNDLNHYSDYFSCLQKEEKLFETVSEIKKIREFESDKTYIPSLNDGLEVVKKVTGVKKDLENSKLEFDKLKQFKSSETDEFNVFKTSGELSKVIGEAVQGVANMKNALDKRTETIDKVLNNIQFVENNQKLLTDPTDIKNIQELINLKSSIQSMYSTLDTFISGVKDNDSPVLKNHSDLFKSAKSVSGVTGDFLVMISSVENLKKKIPGSNELEELQTSLKIMDAMGLDFTKYKGSFDNSDSSLGDLDIGFAAYNKRMARKATLSTRQQGAQSGSQGSGNNQSEKKGGNTLVVWIIVGLATVFVLGGSAALGYNYYWIPRKRRKRVVQFLNGLMEEIHCIYLKLLEQKSKKEKKKSMTPEEVDEVFNHAWADEQKRSKDQCAKMSRFCSTEECNHNYPMVEGHTMTLKGYGDLFKSDHYHAIPIPYSKKKKVIISHCPTKRAGKIPDTLAKFFWMAKQYRSRTIVLLSSSSEPKHYEHIPENKGDEETSENITIHCLEKETIEDEKKYPKLRGLIEKRKLKIEIKNHKPFIVNHIWYCDWGAANEEVNTDDLAYILSMIENDKTPPIITSVGMKKSQCLAFGLLGHTMVYESPGINSTMITQKLSSFILGGFDEPRTYRTSILLLYDFLIHSHGGRLVLKPSTIDHYNKYRYDLTDEEPSVKDKVSPKKEIPAKTEAPLKNDVKSEVPPKK